MNISSITCDGVGITAKVMVKNDATFDATKGDLYAKLLESAEKHEVELSFEKRKSSFSLRRPSESCKVNVVPVILRQIFSTCGGWKGCKMDDLGL